MLIHQKLPTDNLLKDRGCKFASICCFCRSNEEYIKHLLFDCAFAKSLWNWFGKMVNLYTRSFDLEDLFLFCTHGKSRLCSLLLKATFVYLLYTIWMVISHHFH
ncbi:hypothetical protein KIW84_011692 [Lathyrus oleraceus]|uniref:Reverse transcriptase zinc-binding domain-containing protein n=1 Tax=Pisum sativum TaxID=3888 RepID=A0A9D5BFN9_PEA|nr:hypothetical protein KIW84_011692 [Pisum sativum]